MVNLHCKCQELKPKGDTNSSFLVLHPSLGVHTVKTVGSHLKLTKKLSRDGVKKYWYQPPKMVLWDSEEVVLPSSCMFSHLQLQVWLYFHPELYYLLQSDNLWSTVHYPVNALTCPFKPRWNPLWFFASPSPRMAKYLLGPNIPLSWNFIKPITECSSPRQNVSGIPCKLINSEPLSWSAWPIMPWT